MPKKQKLLPFKATLIACGQKTQLTLEEDGSAVLLPDILQRIQKIVGSLLYYACTVDSKLLVYISAIKARQAKSTILTEAYINILLD